LGAALWARGYFAASSTNVTDEVVMKYIAQQSHESPDSDFKIGGDL
jgi:putative transposase